jgi:hypothetical protein
MAIAFLSAFLYADIAPPPSPWDDIQMSLYVHGFQSHPGQRFYQVQANWLGGRNVTYSRVTKDSLLWYNDSKYELRWLTSDPSLEGEKVVDLDYQSMIDGAYTLKYRDHDPYQMGYTKPLSMLGFDKIETHYVIVENTKRKQAEKYPFGYVDMGRRYPTPDPNIPPYIVELDRIVLEHKDFVAVIQVDHERYPKFRGGDPFEYLEIFHSSRFFRLMTKEQFSNQDIIDLFTSLLFYDGEIHCKSLRAESLVHIADILIDNMDSGTRDPYSENEQLTSEQLEYIDGISKLRGITGFYHKLTRLAQDNPAYVGSFWRALIFSIMIEFFVLWALFPLIIGKAIKRFREILRLFLYCAIGTAFTISILWWVVPAAIASMTFAILIGEFIAVIGESLLYKRFLRLSIKGALILSFAANLVSFISGYLLMG